MQQRGAALIAVIFFVVIMSMLAGATAYLVAGDSAATVDHLAAEQALNIAQAGTEIAAFQYKSGTACAALINTSVALGSGTYTTAGNANVAATALTAGVTAAGTVIPVVSVAGVAAHGRVSIQSEEINYTATDTTVAGCAPVAPPCLTGARRAQAGTGAAAHAGATLVSQNQCLIRSIGSVGNARRTVDIAMLPAKAAFLDGGSVAVGSAVTTIGTLVTTLPAGDNVVLAKVSFRNTNNNRRINPGDLRLLRGATLLASNQFIIDVGRSPPSANNFPQESQYILFRDLAVPANTSYSVTAQANNNNINAEVKMLAFNGVPNSSFQDGGGVAMGSGPGLTTLLTHNSAVPAGTNVLMAVVQLDNTAGGTRTISAGDLRLARGATLLSTNQFALNLARASRVNQGTAMLLLARDVGAPAGPVYTVSGMASNNGVNAEVKIAVLNGVLSDFLDGGSVAVATTATTMGALATTFPAGENLVIASSQYENASGGARSILAGNERIVFAGVPQATSSYDIDLCSGTPECNDFDKGILWRQPTAAPDPAYSLQVLASGVGINGETKLLAIHLGNPAVDWQEIIQ